MMKRLLMLALCGLTLMSCQQIEPETDTPSVGDTPEKPQNYVALPGRPASASETTSAFDAAAAAYARQPQQQAAASASAPEPPPIADPAEGLLSQVPVTPASSAPYALQIVNGTQGRLFIEAQDDSNNIFPFGFMHMGQRINSQPQEPRLIMGNLTVIVRDPDRPNAPEIRRYHITPPQGYEGHTLSITILPGGRYRVMIDDRIVYTTPEAQ